MVANRLGKTDDTTAVPIRDNAIIDACKQIYQDCRFSFLKKKSTVSLDSSGVGNMPADFLISYEIEKAYQVVNGVANDHFFTRIDPSDSDFYSSSDYVYWITYDATNKVFIFNSNQVSITVTFWYFFQPADLSGSTDITPIPDATAIRDLSVALYWLAGERDEANYDRFYAKYERRLDLMRAHDKVYNTGRRALKTPITGDDGPSVLMTKR